MHPIQETTTRPSTLCIQHNSVCKLLDYRLFTLSLLLLPIKLSWFLACFVPLVLLWSSNLFLISADTWKTINYKHLYPFFVFIIICFGGAFFGLDPLRSLSSLTSLIFYSLIILITREQFTKGGLLMPILALLFGQTLAGIHSIVSTTTSTLTFTNFLPGPVTESGQIALVLILSIGLGFFLREQVELRTAQLPAFPTLRFSIPIVLFCFFCLTSLGHQAIPEYFRIILVVLGFIIVLFCIAEAFIKKEKLGADRAILYLLLEIIIPILLTTLIINLKRGPWAGVFIGSLVMLQMFSRRLILPITLSVLALILFLPPVRERLAHSYDHFLISGGRKAIWEIGYELTLQYPLGIGLRNSPVLRNFSTEIPDQLKHFHNNLLNITVETGWLGVAVYLWWISCTILHAWKIPKNKNEAILARAAACSIISWQIAGCVEYNFGDSEIVIIAFFIIGLITYLCTTSQTRLSSSSEPLERSNL